jgi:hypothetical protein
MEYGDATTMRLQATQHLLQCCTCTARRGQPTHNVTAAPALVGVVVVLVLAWAGVSGPHDDGGAAVPAGAVPVQVLACRRASSSSSTGMFRRSAVQLKIDMSYAKVTYHEHVPVVCFA